MKKLTCLLALLLLLSLSLGACAEEPETPNTYTFKAGALEIAVDAEAETILSSLGEPKSYDESPSCAYEDLDKVYTYAGFEIKTYTLKKVEYIASIRILDDSCQTQKGIAIGSAKDAVTKAYGAPTSETDSALFYEAEGMKLQFLLRDGLVSDIQYLKNEAKK